LKTITSLTTPEKEKDGFSPLFTKSVTHAALPGVFVLFAVVRT
jgi:hypothetical protein